MGGALQPSRGPEAAGPVPSPPVTHRAHLPSLQARHESELSVDRDGGGEKHLPCPARARRLFQVRSAPGLP